MAQGPLIVRRDLLNHGAGSDFVAQFDLNPIDLQVVIGGALGTMTVQWRIHGDPDTNWSQAKLSSAGASWAWDAPDPAYASITFPAAGYLIGDSWTIDTLGNITAQTGTHPVTAVRNDVVAAMIARVSSKIAEWTQPRVVPPILSLGEGQKGGAAVIVIYWLKSRQGMTPTQAGTGDENWRALALDAQRDFEAIGRSATRPPDLIDSSAAGGTTGAGIPAMPVSRS